MQIIENYLSYLFNILRVLLLEADKEPLSTSKLCFSLVRVILTLKTLRNLKSEIGLHWMLLYLTMTHVKRKNKNKGKY